MLTLFRRRPTAGAIVRDAERMIRDLGPEAFSAAADMSWREDAGLIAERRAGHWHAVQIEIGRRLGRTAMAPQVRRDRGDEHPSAPHSPRS